MTIKIINYPEIGDVIVSKRKSSRSVRLTIDHDGNIRVTLPHWAPYKVAEAFVISKSAWIKESKTKVYNHIFVPNERIGKNHRIVFIPSINKTVTAKVLPTQIVIKHPQSINYDASEVQKIARRYCIKALKQQAVNLLPNRLSHLAVRYGFSYKKVTIKAMRSRWGSCSSDKTITLNCYLMQLPWDLIDYVLLHELVHTNIMAHGSPFWTELGRYVSNLSTKRRLIKEHKPSLMPQT